MALVNSDVFFYFGKESGSFLIDTPHTFKHSKLPGWATESLDAKSVGKIRWFSINYGVKGADKRRGTGVSLEDTDGASWQLLDTGISESLDEWLGAKNSDHGAANVSLTITGDSAIACCGPADAWSSKNIPTGCEAKINEKSNVRLVALGRDESYVILHGKGQHHWNLKGNYKNLDQILNMAGSRRIQFIALNPWRREEFLVLFDDKLAYFSVHESCFVEIKEILVRAGCNIVGAT